VIGDREDEQSRECKHQTQQQEPQYLDDHASGQHTLDRQRRGQQQVKVGIE